MVMEVVVMNKVNLVNIGRDEKVIRPHTVLREKAFKQETSETAKKEYLIKTNTKSGKINFKA